MAFIQCESCDPLRRDARHRDEQISLFFERLFPTSASFGMFGKRANDFLNEKGEIILFRIACALHLFVEKSITQELESQIYNRTLVLVHEARKRGVDMRVFTCFGQCTKFFSMVVKGKKIIFDELPTLPLEIDDTAFSNKFLLKETLQKAGFPTPEGIVCRTLQEAESAGQILGFPLVVKPALGSQSKHTTCNITSLDALAQAAKSALVITNEFVVERYISGDVHRVTTIDKKFFGCCTRELPNVVGDGVHTIQELITIKNNDDRRGPPSKKNTTLHRIETTPFNIEVLARKGLTLDSVPVDGEKIYLHSKIILSGGADFHERTKELHQDTVKLFEDVSQVLNFPLLGLDFICEDISRSWRDQEFAIIEANSKPSIDLHHYPVTGEVRNAAGAVLDYIIETTQ